MSPAFVAATVRIEAQLVPGVWTNLTADVHAESGIHWARGLAGNGPSDRVASTGLLEFSLRNDARNYGATAGWYSPDAAVVRTGFTFGIPVRVIVNDGSDHVQWRGRLRTIDPDPGVNGPRLTHCTAQDCLGDLADSDVRSIPPQVNQTEVQLLTAVLAALPTDAQPPATDFDTAVDVYPYAFDDIAGGVKALDAAGRAVQSAQGLLYAKADGTLRYDNRHTTTLKTSLFTFTDAVLTEDGFEMPRALTNVYNRIRITIHPKTVTAATVLYALTGAQLVNPGQTVTIWGSYADPTNTLKLIGGAAPTVPIVATTDYLGNALADGSGADLTTSLSVVTSAFAADVQFDVTNGSASPVYVTKLQLRGTAIYDNAPVTVESFTAQTYGDQPFDLDLPYQADANVAKDLADYLKLQYMRLANQVTGLSFLARRSSALLTQALTREIGDVLTVTEPQTGVSGITALILGIDVVVEEGARLTYRYLLGSRTVSSAFIFDDAVLGVFDAPVALFGYA